MDVIDLIETPDEHLWKQTVDAIEKNNEPLKENYLNIDFSQFLSFPCVVQSGNIICFSGLQYDESKWGSGIARCSSRMWVHPEYRFTGLTKFSGGRKFLNSSYCLPVQFEKARKVGLDTLFISREKNLEGFKKYTELIHINCGVKFDLKPNRYWVCGPAKGDGCLQYVAVADLTTSSKEIWLKNMFRYLDI